MPTKIFRLAVWKDNNGIPGELIYEQIGVRPLFTDSLNRFSLYRIEQPVWIEAGTFYIGWIQTTPDMLNVGFDMNRVSNSKLFYNITGQWINSQYEGSLMLRPVFGALTEPPTHIPVITKEFDFSIYPNPAQTQFSISTDLPHDISIRVFNTMGQMVLSTRHTNQPISVDNLPNGIYIVHLSTQNSMVGTRKLIISR